MYFVLFVGNRSVLYFMLDKLNYHHVRTVCFCRSSSFMFFSLNFSGYFCWTFTKVNDDMYYFYEHTGKLYSLYIKQNKSPV